MKVERTRERVRNDCFERRVPPPPGILYEYQKKGDTGEGLRMIIKTKGIGRPDGGGNFELGSITLVSVARQDYQVNS